MAMTVDPAGRPTNRFSGPAAPAADRRGRWASQQVGEWTVAL